MAFVKCATVVKLIFIMMMALMSMEIESAHLSSSSSSVNNVHASKRSPKRSTALQRFLNFRCGTPQQRAYFLPDLLLENNLLNEGNIPKIHPHYLVVNRCDGQAGCCQSYTEICSPKKGTIDMEYLDVIYEYVDNGGKETVKLAVEKHTVCECSGNRTKDHTMSQIKPKIHIVK